MTSVIIVRSVVLFKRGAVRDKNVSTHTLLWQWPLGFMQHCIHCKSVTVSWVSMANKHPQQSMANQHPKLTFNVHGAV